MSEPARTELSLDPTDYLTGPTSGEAARTQGGTNREGGVSTFGSSRTGGGEPLATTDPDDGKVSTTDATTRSQQRASGS